MQVPRAQGAITKYLDFALDFCTEMFKISTEMFMVSIELLEILTECLEIWTKLIEISIEMFEIIIVCFVKNLICIWGIKIYYLVFFVQFGESINKIIFIFLDSLTINYIYNFPRFFLK